MEVEAICYTDGASRGNPGKAAIGVVIIHQASKQIHKFSRYLGDNLTNNYAEYSAIIFCLERLIDAGIKTFELRSDSELVIKQIKGEYKVSAKNIISLHQKVMELLKYFKYYYFIHFKRKYNKLADQLANNALDRN